MTKAHRQRRHRPLDARGGGASCQRIMLSVVAVMFIVGCDLLQPKAPDGAKTELHQAAERNGIIQRACASNATYGRLKELTFDEARRVRNEKNNPGLDQLAATTVIRMEDPVVKSRDEKLNVTVCTGRMILELPPNVANAFGGDQRLTARVEYAAQAAADGSGLIYQMDGAEPIVYRLAAFDVRRSVDPAAASAEPIGTSRPGPLAKADGTVLAPPVLPSPRREEPHVTSPRVSERQTSSTKVVTRPSFNCRYARSRVENMICTNEGLAAQDRRMASLYFAALAEADRQGKEDLRRSRGDFVAARDTCRTEECVWRSYDERIVELRDYHAEVD